MIEAIKIAGHFLRDHDLQAMDGHILIAIVNCPGISSKEIQPKVGAAYPSLVTRGLERLLRANLVRHEGSRTRREWHATEATVELLQHERTPDKHASVELDRVIAAKKKINEALDELH